MLHRDTEQRHLSEKRRRSILTKPYCRCYRPSPLHPLKMTFCFLLFPFISPAFFSLCVRQPPFDDRQTDRDSWLIVFSPFCGATLWAVSCIVVPQRCWESKLCTGIARHCSHPCRPPSVVINLFSQAFHLCEMHKTFYALCTTFLRMACGPCGQNPRPSLHAQNPRVQVRNRALCRGLA